MPSFDIVSEVDKQEVRNAVDQVNKEVGTRFDFKGSDARVEYADCQLILYADDEGHRCAVLGYAISRKN